ncbi:Dephospho-CoA kinase [uncultured Paludibacter sp.]|uniref:Dephospho-CoA kinase n=1 Tax=uncultured Paludibacter sp. TaxID=497635 RepID=A0A653A5G9_9BACT|nr:Dephospho-CoA kinase [uncultured Paludibacter sp.]
MQKPIIIGITGGIGGGKSTFSEFLRECGELVFDTDLEAKNIQDIDSKTIFEIKNLFGEKIYTEKGLDRVTVAKIVFNDKKKLYELNEIIHPKVKNRFKEWVKKHSDRKYLFMECAILYEAGFDAFVDKVVVVTAPEDIRIRRVILRDGLDEKQVRERIKNQIPDEEKITKANWVVNTDNCRKNIECVKDFLEMINS